MITPLGWLERVPTYKDQIENLVGKDLTTYGFLGYPLLQSADILLYRPQFVPVGADQVAHVELTREVARRFNHLYARDGRAHDMQSVMSEPVDPEHSVFPEPDVLLTPSPKLPGTDGRKMSKSYNNAILLSEPEHDIRQKLKTMVTDPARVRRSDPGNPDICPVGDLHKVFSSKETQLKVWDGCRSAGIGCIECKGWAADAILDELRPMRERRAEWEREPARVNDMLADGAHRARKFAGSTMDLVRDAMNLVPPRKNKDGNP
jgi:tryptophanyl-tRNA synthetase